MASSQSPGEPESKDQNRATRATTRGTTRATRVASDGPERESASESDSVDTADLHPGPDDAAATITAPPEAVDGSTIPGANERIAEGYALGAIIGRGGLARINVALQRAFGRTVAIKTLRKKRRQQRAQFCAEARLAAHLQHPNILPIYDLIEDHSGQLQIVMKRIEGTTWAELLEQDAGEREGFGGAYLRNHLGILLQLCQGLAYIHDRGIVHRDVKPANVMVGDYGEVLLMDFGCAAVWQPSAEFAGLPLVADARNVVGTPCYMAPEQAKVDVGAMGPATDIYLVGACLFEILTGKPPHPGRDMTSAITAARNNEILPADLEGRSDDPPHELLELARACLSDDPRERPRSIRAFTQQVETFLTHDRARTLMRSARRHLREATRGLEGASEHLRRAINFAEEATSIWPEHPACHELLFRAWLISAKHAMNLRDFSTADQHAQTAAELAQDPAQLADAREVQREARDNQRQLGARQRLVRTMRTTIQLMAVGMTLGLVVLVVWAVISYTRIQSALHSEQRARLKADEARRVAQEALTEAEAENYQATIPRAHEALEAGAYSRAVELLMRAPVSNRDWEWQHLLRRSRLGIVDLEVGGLRRGHLVAGPEGNLVAAAGVDVCRIYETEDWTTAGSFELPGIEPSRPDFAPAGGWLSLAGEEEALLLDTRTWRECWRADPGAPVVGTAWNDDGSLVFHFTPHGVLALDTERGEVRARSLESEAFVAAAPAGPDRAVAIHEDGAICLIAIAEDGRARIRRRNAEHPVLAGAPLAVAKDGGRIAVVGAQGAVRVLDGDELRARRSIRVNEPVTALRFLDGGRSLAIGTEGGLLAIHDLAGDGRPFRAREHRGAVISLAELDATRLVSAGGEGGLKLWPLHRTDSALVRITAHEGPCNGLAWHPDGGRFASAGEDGTIGIWNADTGAAIAEVNIGKSPVRSLDWSPDGRHILAGTGLGQVVVIEATTGSAILRHQVSPNAIVAVAFDRSGLAFYAAGHRGNLHRLRLDDAAPMAMPLDVGVPIASMAVGDSEHLALGTEDGHLLFVGAADLHLAEDLLTGGEAVMALAFDRGDVRLAVGDRLGSLAVYSIAEHRRLATVDEHQGRVRCLGWSRSGKRLVSGSDDGRIRIRHAVSGDVLLMFDDPSAPLRDLCFSPDGTHLAAADASGTIHVYRAEDSR